MGTMSEFSKASQAAGSGIDRLNAFTEELHDWSLNGKKPVLASRELRYVLGQQKQRLQRLSCLPGIVTDSKPVQSKNVECTIALTPLGMSIDSRLLQYRKVSYPRLVKLAGSFMSDSS